MGRHLTTLGTRDLYTCWDKKEGRSGMTHQNIFYYGGRYPIRTNLVSPKQASTSTDLRDETCNRSDFDSGTFTNTYDMASYHQTRLQNSFTFDEDLAPSFSGVSGNSNISSKTSGMQGMSGEFDSSSQESSNHSSSSIARSEESNSDMDFEVYQSSASLVKHSLAPCPLQIPLDETCFYPRATSTPTMSPENSSSITFKSCLAKPDRSDRKAVKRKLRFASEDDEAVYYLQTKYLHQEAS